MDGDRVDVDRVDVDGVDVDVDRVDVLVIPLVDTVIGSDIVDALAIESRRWELASGPSVPKMNPDSPHQPRPQIQLKSKAKLQLITQSKPQLGMRQRTPEHRCSCATRTPQLSQTPRFTQLQQSETVQFDAQPKPDHPAVQASMQLGPMQSTNWNGSQRRVCALGPESQTRTQDDLPFVVHTVLDEPATKYQSPLQIVSQGQTQYRTLQTSQEVHRQASQRYNGSTRSELTDGSVVRDEARGVYGVTL